MNLISAGHALLLATWLQQVPGIICSTPLLRGGSTLNVGFYEDVAVSTNAEVSRNMHYIIWNDNSEYLT